jgi:hypothetical protein
MLAWFHPHPYTVRNSVDSSGERNQGFVASIDGGVEPCGGFRSTRVSRLHYQEIRTPILPGRPDNDIVTEEMYSFEDRDGGGESAVRIALEQTLAPPRPPGRPSSPVDLLICWMACRALREGPWQVTAPRSSRSGGESHSSLGRSKRPAQLKISTLSQRPGARPDARIPDFPFSPDEAAGLCLWPLILFL